MKRFRKQQTTQESFEESDYEDFVLNVAFSDRENITQDNILQDSPSDNSEDVNALLQATVCTPQNIQQGDIPEYLMERIKKTEAGPPYAWKSNQPPIQVRTPLRNIIRTGLSGVRGAARTFGDKPTKTNLGSSIRWILLWKTPMKNLKFKRTFRGKYKQYQLQRH